MPFGPPHRGDMTRRTVTSPFPSLPPVLLLVHHLMRKKVITAKYLSNPFIWHTMKAITTMVRSQRFEFLSARHAKRLTPLCNYAGSGLLCRSSIYLHHRLILWFLGITIFDITQPSNVRYCFVDFMGMESNTPVQLMTPLTARAYLESYYDLTNPIYSTSMIPLVDEFKAWDVIPVETLRETWPKGQWEDKWEETEAELSVRDEVPVPQLEGSETGAPDTSTTLRKGALATSLQPLSDGRDDHADFFLEAELLSDSLRKLKEKLYQQSGAVKPSPRTMDLLCRALEQENDVDLSPFTRFSAEDMSLVVSRLRKHGKMHTLCISNRSDLTAEDLQVVLRNAAGLKAVYVLEDPQLPAHGVNLLLEDCDFYNSELLRQAIKPGSRRTVSSSFITGSVCKDNISQLLWIGISYPEACKKRYRLETGQFDWKTLLEVQTDCGWSEHGLKYKRYPVDMPLSTFRTVAGLLCLFKWGSSPNLQLFENDLEKFSQGAALSFALASTIQGDNKVGIDAVGGDKGVGIGPLVPGLYRDSDALEDLEPGKWAVVFIHEAYNFRQEVLDHHPLTGRTGAVSDSKDGNDLPLRAVKRLRYALVTPCIWPQPSGHQFVVADIPTYLEYTMGRSYDKGRNGELEKLVEAYNSGIATMDNADFYREDDIHDRRV